MLKRTVGACLIVALSCGFMGLSGCAETATSKTESTTTTPGGTTTTTDIKEIKTTGENPPPAAH